MESDVPFYHYPPKDNQPYVTCGYFKKVRVMVAEKKRLKRISPTKAFQIEDKWIVVAPHWKSWYVLPDRADEAAYVQRNYFNLESDDPGKYIVADVIISYKIDRIGRNVILIDIIKLCPDEPINPEYELSIGSCVPDNLEEAFHIYKTGRCVFISRLPGANASNEEQLN